MYMLNMVIILIVMYCNVITAIDKIPMYLLRFNTDIEGDQQGSKGQCTSSVTVPHCRCPAASRRGTRRIVGIRFSGVYRWRNSHAEGRLVLGRSRGGRTVDLFQFNYHYSPRRFPGCAILALLGERISHIFSSRTVTARSVET